MGVHLNEDYFGGDLKGIQQKLPYLHEMGAVSYTHLDVYKRQDLSGAAADVHDHAAGGLADGQARTDGSGHGLLDHRHLTGTSRCV